MLNKCRQSRQRDSIIGEYQTIYPKGSEAIFNARVHNDQNSRYGWMMAALEECQKCGAIQQVSNKFMEAPVIYGLNSDFNERKSDMESALQTVDTMYRAGEAAKSRLYHKLNLRVRVDLGPDGFLKAVETTSKKGILPEMSAAEAPISPKESAYIVLVDEDGKIAATVAARVFNCYRNGFTRMLANLYSTHYADGADAFDTTDIPPVFSDISGLACYVGEFHFEPEWRRKIDISDLSAIAYCEAYRRFVPDWYFGFTRAKHARAGLAARYFGSRTCPNAIQWKVPSEIRLDSDWFVCSTVGEIEFAMRRYFLGANAAVPQPIPTLEAALQTSF